MWHPYHLLDVFTDRPFGGNPLAVFPDAGRLDPSWMPRIAAELNLSETAFVLPPRNPSAARRVRIFTPRIELPFAGHPTIGAAILLAESNAVPLVAGRGRLLLEEEVGTIHVEIRTSEAGPTFADLEIPGPGEIREAPPRETVAALIGLDLEDLAPAEIPRAASAGVPYLLIPVRDRPALARVRLDHDVWTAEVSGSWAPHLYVYARDGVEEGVPRMRTRMFAPAMGIAEDPATGAGGAALAVALGTGAGDGPHRWVVDQGIEIGRPSRIRLEAETRGGEIRTVRVGGTAVRIGEGRMEIPE